MEGAEPELEEVERVVGRPSSIVEKRCVLYRFQRQRAKLVTRRQSTEILADVLCDDVERSVMQPFQPLSRRQKRRWGVMCGGGKFSPRWRKRSNKRPKRNRIIARSWSVMERYVVGNIVQFRG